MADTEIEIVEVRDDTDPEVVRAGVYLKLKYERKTMTEIAVALGYSERRQTVYDLVRRWEKNGVLKQARDLFRAQHAGDINDARARVMEAWPQIIDRQITTALKSKSDRMSLEAAAWLANHVVTPEMNKAQEDGDAESEYARKPAESNPMMITLPKPSSNK